MAGEKLKPDMSKRDEHQKLPSLITHMIAGGMAGFVECSICHPLDTLKVRMQLTSRQITSGVGKTQMALQPARNGSFTTALNIYKNEGIRAFYKGYSPVVSAIVPKMAIRFYSFEMFKKGLGDAQRNISTIDTFLAGIGAGIVETLVVVNPMEVVKIRLQAQKNVLASTNAVLAAPVLKYNGALDAIFVIAREEGLLSFYKGVTLTAARQASNQAVNFTLYQNIKDLLARLQNKQSLSLPSWQYFLAGGISGTIAPICNAPLDTIKTRIQKQTRIKGESEFSVIKNCGLSIFQKEGIRGFYNGLAPRLMRIAPGQAITFAVYERTKPFVARFIDDE